MSSEPTKITDEIQQYILKYFNSEDDFLARLQKEAAAEGIPEIWISPEQGKFLQTYLLATNVKYVLEIGTLAAYSAITMARVLPPGGRLITVEIDKFYANFARRKIEEANLSKTIDVVNADANEYVENLVMDNKFDFVFIDASKPDYENLFDKILPFVRSGGTIAADNAFGFGYIAKDNPEYEPENVVPLQRFIKNLVQREDLSTCIVPVGDGMTLSVKF